MFKSSFKVRCKPNRTGGFTFIYACIVTSFHHNKNISIYLSMNKYLSSSLWIYVQVTKNISKIINYVILSRNITGICNLFIWFCFHNRTHVLRSGLVHQEHGITSTVTQKGDLSVKHTKVQLFDLNRLYFYFKTWFM